MSAPYRRIRGGGFHAEEKAVNFVKGLANMKPNPLPKDASLFFQPSKSPCTSEGPTSTRADGKTGCLQHINALNNTEINGTTFHCTMGATKPYCPKMQGGRKTSKNAYNGCKIPHASFVRPLGK